MPHIWSSLGGWLSIDIANGCSMFGTVAAFVQEFGDLRTHAQDHHKSLAIDLHLNHF